MCEGASKQTLVLRILPRRDRAPPPPPPLSKIMGPPPHLYTYIYKSKIYLINEKKERGGVKN